MITSILQLSEILLFISGGLILIPLIIFVNKRLYTNIKNEERQEKGKVIQFIIKTYALVQCIGWPCLFIAYGLIKLIQLFSIDYLSIKSFGSIYRFLYTLLRDYLQFHSLILATCRYMFIVLPSTSTKIGIDRLRKLLIFASMGIPILTTTLYELTCPIEKTYINWFYGQKLNRNIHNHTYDQWIKIDSSELESAAFVMFNRFLPSSFTHAVSMIENVLFSIIYSNLIEGCIYIYIIIFLKR